MPLGLAVVGGTGEEGHGSASGAVEKGMDTFPGRNAAREKTATSVGLKLRPTVQLMAGQ